MYLLKKSSHLKNCSTFKSFQAGINLAASILNLPRGITDLSLHISFVVHTFILFLLMSHKLRKCWSADLNCFRCLWFAWVNTYCNTVCIWMNIIFFYLECTHTVLFFQHYGKAFKLACARLCHLKSLWFPISTNKFSVCHSALVMVTDDVHN